MAPLLVGASLQMFTVYNEQEAQVIAASEWMCVLK